MCSIIVIPNMQCDMYFHVCGCEFTHIEDGMLNLGLTTIFYFKCHDFMKIFVLIKLMSFLHYLDSHLCMYTYT